MSNLYAALSQLTGISMGQAKLRGTQQARIIQAKAKRLPPTPGLYVSTKEVQDMRLIVEDVTVLDDAENEGSFLVSMIDEASAGDGNAAGDELDPEQWFALVDQYGLVRADG
jgi:hypothetical protein